MKTEKLNLRERIKQTLKEQNEDKHYCNFQSQKALIELYNFDLFKKASCVLSFVSYGTEIKTNQLLDIILNENKMLCLPRTENEKMEFYYINSDEDFSEQTEIGEYGITVPKSNQDKLDINSIPDKTLIIIPGLAFDERGNRLGKGKGYYDKFLAELLSTSEKEKILGIVGYCYDFQIIDKVITEPNDIPVDYIISDKRIVKSKVNNK
ncbi:MAG: 5-formyltetrahydrofolate cyclo-ligase [Spirochaetaceae bacterium]|nr:5-formyltetrahydrofolate cyclo-ligase [Spirochaetaceae bacterium]MBR4011952.1 5-formyltetrahydrofolate cyclo-ligase [Spirochaetaceae bacterium]